ncbi:MAG: GtrA family protein [Clostridia bacterium]|nr:GtrA family protein [Clostridia bacterium]
MDIKKLTQDARIREIVVYTIFGVLATAVDFGSYIVMTRLLNLDEHFSNILAQFLAIIFAFFTNKIFVFNDKVFQWKTLSVQLGKFVSLRLITLALNSILFSFLVEKFHTNDIISKIVVAVVVVILNYIFSKLIIFKHKEG